MTRALRPKPLLRTNLAKDSGWAAPAWFHPHPKIGMMFGPRMGTYMYHCHVLKHEDMGMTRNLMGM